ncbi:gene transfer agent family protein [Xanthobacter sp. TB0139]|uniref:gene transfer agent family protein n=1 Tax=Xanthobacter sp. TB0139 TaxID=3459178 RepID=UPI0040397ACF
MAGFDARVTRPWGDGDTTFRLTLDGLLELQDKVDSGPLAIALRLQGDDWRVEDVRETLRLGLIGGGKTPAQALALVARYVDRRPLLENVPVAREVIYAALAQPDDAPGNPVAAAQTDGSPLPPSTSAVP